MAVYFTQSKYINSVFMAVYFTHSMNISLLPVSSIIHMHNGMRHGVASFHNHTHIHNNINRLTRIYPIAIRLTKQSIHKLNV